MKTELKLSIGTKETDESGEGKKGEDSWLWEGQAKSILHICIKLSLWNLAPCTMKKRKGKVVQFTFGKWLNKCKRIGDIVKNSFWTHLMEITRKYMYMLGVVWPFWTSIGMLVQ